MPRLRRSPTAALLRTAVCLWLLGQRGWARDVLPEYDVKAACLFNIAKFTDWPASAFAQPGAPIVIGVLGQDPFGSVLDRIVKGRVINNRPVVIRRASRHQELSDAHLVFISNSERARAAQIASTLENSSVLCVGDIEETAAIAAINFSVAGGRTVFTVNLARTSRAGVKISSKLLHLAAAVTGGSTSASR